MNAFQLRQLTIPLTIRSEVLFRLEDGTELEPVCYQQATAPSGRKRPDGSDYLTEDVVLVLRVVAKKVEPDSPP